ncbi:sugar phosphate isomerase/epimerase [Dyadobacter sp. CY261]|uniref:sugar phosphate isomerase/epimerase family protein n=1 Tax=Dyadobacter sp. CY261 TaxID=2907203 RepID=UPI001F46C6DA|nr:sugar phosphate isomerase/epimerase family protein [Dyadobacter sp. CY261]MCF0074673.1 sugar phosphate isomerase/epimerase [Dyadobacter sp. CY261]
MSVTTKKGNKLAFHAIDNIFPDIFLNLMNRSSSFTRRDFLAAASASLALPLVQPLNALAKAKPLLSFSTLACPKWDWATIVKYASDNGYHGIEIRGVLDCMDLPKCNDFGSPQNIAQSRKLAEDKGLRIVDLGSSAALHMADPAERKKNLDEAKRFIDLAQQLNCPYVRVFPNDLPKDQEVDKTVELISTGLLELGEYAKNTSVTVLLESHGDVTKKDILANVMGKAEHKHVGLIWDIFNMWSVTKEPPKEVYAQLKQYIRHTHIKDGILEGGKIRYVAVGKGEGPLQEAISVLVKDNYKGYYSFEWEKKWHPEIEDPEIVIPAYPKLMQQYF